jgi:hypothetical protein
MIKQFTGLALVGLLAACGGPSANAPTSAPMAEMVEEAVVAETSTIRFAHAAAAPAVDVMANGAPLSTNLGMGTFNVDRLTVPAGAHTLTVAPHGTMDAVVTADVTLDGGVDYTVIVIGDAASVVRDTMPTALVLTNDVPETDAGQARVRFVHAVPGGPAVNIGTDAGRGFATGVNYTDVSNAYAIAAGQHMITVTAGEASVLSAPVGFAEGRLYTIIVRPDGDGVGATVINEAM